MGDLRAVARQNLADRGDRRADITIDRGCQDTVVVGFLDAGVGFADLLQRGLRAFEFGLDRRRLGLERERALRCRDLNEESS